MANIKITELNAIGSLAATDVLVTVDVSADETKKITTADLFRTVPNGSASAPGLAFGADQDLGLYRVGANSLGISTGGTQRFTIDGSGNVTISGGLTVEGQTTTVESTVVTIDDKNIELGSVASPSNTTADGGGITLKGATDKTIKWINSTGYWTFNTGIDVAGEVECNSLDVDGVADISGNLNVGSELGLLGTTDENKFLDCRLGSNSFYIRGTSGGDSNHANLAQFIRGGAVVLFHNNNQKFATKSDGIDVTGEVQCDFLDVDGGVDIDGGQVFYDATNNLLRWADGARATFGAGNDLQIKHDGTNTIIDNNTGDLYIQTTGSGDDIVLQAKDDIVLQPQGSENGIQIIGNGSVRLAHNNVFKLETTSTGIDVTGEAKSDSLFVQAASGLGNTAGDSQDLAEFRIANTNASKLKIVEERDANGTDWTTSYTRIQKVTDVTNQGYIQFNGSDLNYGIEFGTQSDERFARFIKDGAVALYYDNNLKFQTKSDGIDVTGEVQCDSLDVDGTADITGNVTLHGNLDLQDDDNLNIGAGNDFTIRHNGIDSIFENDTGHLYVSNYANDKGIFLRSDNGSGGIANYVYCDGSNGQVTLYHYGSGKANTKSDGFNVTGELQCDSLDVDGSVDITGEVNLHSNLKLQDSDVIKCGSGNDLQIYHNNTHSYIKEEGTGELRIGSNNAIRITKHDSETLALFSVDGSVDLYYDNSRKFHTKSDGVDITGELQCDSLDVDGAVDVTGNVTLRAGINTNGEDVYTGNGAFIANDADGAFAARSGGNIDHFWHNDTTNTWHFCSDTTYKNNGNANIQGNRVYVQDLLIHAGDDNTHIGFPSSDTFRVTTNNTERFRVTSTGALAFAGASNYGTAGQVLKSTGNGAPIWQDIGSVAVGGATAITMNDNVNINFGNSNDMKLFHDGTNSLLVNEVGSFTIRQNANDSDFVVKSDDGAGGIADYLRCDGSNGTVRLSYYGAEKAYTKSDGFDVVGELQCDSLDVDGNADISGVLVLHNNLDMQDHDTILMGSGDDFKLFHNGVNSHVQNYTGGLFIDQHVDNNDIVLRTDNGAGSIADYVRCDGSDGVVRLYSYGTEKFKTKSDGIDVQGEVQCDSLDVDGSADVSGNVTVGAELNMMGSSDNNKYLDVRLGSNAFHIRGTSGGDVNHETLAKFIRNAQVELYHNASKKFETTSYGALTSGELRCQVLKAFNATNSIGGVLLNTNGSIELHQANHVPFIDFKSSEAEDYDCRIQSSGADLVFHTGGNGSQAEAARMFNSGVFRISGLFNNTTGSGANVHTSSDGTLYRSTSSIKYKKDVETIEDSYSDALLNARPVWYRAKESDGTYDPNWGYYGFIAEEIAEIDPRLVFWKTHEIGKDENNNQTTTKLEEPVAEGVQYERFVPHLLNLIKRQQDTIANLEARVAALEAS